MDIYEEVTRRIVEQMEQGEIPWRKPWIAGGSCVSYATGRPYSLLNQMLLGKPGEYLTFRQCQQAGGHIHRGEKAHMVVFWKWIEQENEETGEKKQIPFLRYYRCVPHQSMRRDCSQTRKASAADSRHRCSRRAHHRRISSEFRREAGARRRRSSLLSTFR